MKKIYLVAILVAFVSFSFAQKGVTSSKNVKGVAVQQMKGDTTLVPTSMLDTACSNHLTYYSASTAGYVTGTNSYGDMEKAQRYNGTGTVSSVLAYIISTTPTSTQNTTIKLYSVNASTLAPNAVLGTSTPVAISALSTTGFTTYTFAAPVAVTSKFYASFVIPAADTAIVISTNSTICNSPDSAAWELWSPGTAASDWHSIVTAWLDASSVGLAIDLAIFPVLTTSASINDDYFINGIMLGQNQPNPASINTLVQYELANNANNVTLDVIDVTGKIVATYNEGAQMAGRHNVVLDANKLSTGIYYYSLKADNNRLTKKMVITE